MQRNEAMLKRNWTLPPEAEKGYGKAGRRRFAEAVAVFCLFAILVCAFTWPLATNLPHYLPPHWDPRLNAWNMSSMSREILANPLHMFRGNDFYPYGTTKSFSEILVVPSLVNAPIFLLSGNPILSYNITLLFFWILSGLTMYLCAREIMGHHWGALLAAIIWTLSPFRTDYYLEFQMQMGFAVPLVILYWYRFLRTQGISNAALAFAFLLVQAVSCWSYALMISVYMPIFSVTYLLLKWRGWKVMKLLGVIPVIAIFCVVIFPFTWPYFVMRKELGMERRLSEAIPHSADVFTYLESGPIRMYHFSPTHHHAETSLFPGFVALAFFVSSFACLFKWNPQVVRSRATRIFRLLATGGLLVSLLQLGLRIGVSPGAAEHVPIMHFSSASLWVVACCLFMLILRGRRQSRGGIEERAFEHNDVLATFLFTFFLMFLLSLGPVVHVKREAIGHGPYYHLYNVIFPLRAVRIVSRFGGMALFSLSILSGLGLKLLHIAVREHVRLLGTLGFLPSLIAAIEYFPQQLDYEQFHWEKQPPVYAFLASDPHDFVVAEWPLGWRNEDADALLWSLGHNKKILGGVSRWRGRMPPRTERLSKTLLRLPFPETMTLCMTQLRAVYPTKYLILHRRFLPAEMWSPWEKLIQNPPEGLVLLRVYENHDYLFAVAPVVERGKEFVREFSYEYLSERTVARFKLRDGSCAPCSPVVEVRFNDRLLRSHILTADWREYRFDLPAPYRKVAPNSIQVVAAASQSSEGQIEFQGFSLSTK